MPYSTLIDPSLDRHQQEAVIFFLWAKAFTAPPRLKEGILGRSWSKHVAGLFGYLFGPSWRQR